MTTINSEKPVENINIDSTVLNQSMDIRNMDKHIQKFNIIYKKYINMEMRASNFTVYMVSLSFVYKIPIPLKQKV